MSRITDHLLQQHEAGNHQFVVEGYTEDGLLPMDITIDKNVPKPGGPKLPLGQMEPGDSFFMPSDIQPDGENDEVAEQEVQRLTQRLRQSVYRYRKVVNPEFNGRFAVHVVNENDKVGCRVFCVEDGDK